MFWKHNLMFSFGKFMLFKCVADPQSPFGNFIRCWSQFYPTKIPVKWPLHSVPDTSHSTRELIARFSKFTRFSSQNPGPIPVLQCNHFHLEAFSLQPSTKMMLLLIAPDVCVVQQMLSVGPWFLWFSTAIMLPVCMRRFCMLPFI